MGVIQIFVAYVEYIQFAFMFFRLPSDKQFSHDCDMKSEESNPPLKMLADSLLYY